MVGGIVDVEINVLIAVIAGRGEADIAMLGAVTAPTLVRSETGEAFPGKASAAGGDVAVPGDRMLAIRTNTAYLGSWQ